MRSARFWSLGAAILVVNIVGILWIHNDLTRVAKPHFRVLSAWPQEAVGQADRLTLVLNEPLAPAQGVGKPLDRAPFLVQPAAAGHWQWASQDKLEYVLDKRLLPGRTYVLRPSGDLEANLGRELVGNREFRFSTDPLRMTSCRVGVCESQAVNIEVTFNQPVGPDDLMRHVVVSDAADNGQPKRKLEISLLTNTVGQSFVIRSERPASQAIHVSIDGRLTGFGAQLPLGKDVSQDLQIATRFALQGADVQRARLEKNFTVYLRFTNPLDTSAKLAGVAVSPKVEGLKVSRENNRLVLEGPFVCGKRYTATVDATLMSKDKQTLKEKSDTTFDIPDREPSLSMSASNGILSPEGNLLFDLEVVNVPGVEVGAFRLHPNNLVAHVRGGDQYGTSRTLKTHTIKLDTPRNVPKTVAMDLRKLLGRPLGVYQLAVSSTGDRWEGRTAVVAVTDLGLTAKKHKEGYTVWVTSLRTGLPAEDVKVSAYTGNNQIIATATTDAQGLAKLAVPPNPADGWAFLIAAERGEDLSYLELEKRPSQDDEYIGGSGRAIPSTYDVMLYCDRGVYRPGETIHLTGIVRDANGRIPPAMPLSLLVDRPDGKRVATLPLAADSSGQGMFHADYQPAEDAQMGSYEFSVTLPGSHDVLGSDTALVEAFIPVRMEVKAQATKPLYGPGDKPEVLANARYLFGLPAADLAAQVKGYYREATFTCPQYADYTFDADCKLIKNPSPAVATRTDGGGQFTSPLEVPKEPRRLWSASFVASVTEQGGRSVSSTFKFQVDTLGRHIGLRLPPSAIVPVQSGSNVDWVLVDMNGKQIAGGPLEWTLERVEWDYVVEQVNGRPVWNNRQRLIAAGGGKLENGKSTGRFEITPSDAGQYRLTVIDAKSGAAAVREFYASRGSDVGSNISKPERLEIVLDRKSYVPGTSAKVLVRSPFAGYLLLTLETDRILDTRVVAMSGKQLELDLPIPPDLRGGAFIAASVVRAVDPDEAKWLPHRAMGLARLATDHSGAKLNVAIESPAKIEPGQKVQVVVKTDKPFDSKRPSVVHLWAVDEGILLTTGFRTPDVHDYFFSPRVLGVDTYDLFWMLLADNKRPAEVTRIGADGGEGGRALRRSPVPMRQRQSTVIWNKSLPVDENGQVTLTMDVPKFTGELRLMAVAVDHDRYGSMKKPLTVASPLLVESSWPRFAAPGDQFKVPVKLFNTTDKPLELSLKVASKGPLELSLVAPNAPRAATTQPASSIASMPATASSQPGVGASEVEQKGLALAAGASRVVWVYATATDLGAVDVAVSAASAATQGPALQAGDEAKFAVRPVVPLTTQTKLVRFEAGGTQKIAPLGNYLRGQTTISLSGRPDVQLRPAIEQLIDYPYGCVEQTTSRLQAILYAPDLLSVDGTPTQRTTMVQEMIAAGIARLWSMQTPDGGLGYWPGDSRSNLWGTAYAASFLARAKKAGVAVDKRFTDALADYLEMSLKKTDTAEADDNMRALLCNVLATFGRPSEGWMNRLSDNLNKLDMAGRANLAAAWLEMGKKDRAAAMLAPDTLKLNVGFSAGGRITSQVSQQAVLLDTLLDLDVSHPWIGLLVARLEEARKHQGRWASTHDNAMCLSALSHYQTLSKDKPSDFKGTLTLAGQAPLEFDHTKPFVTKTDQANAPLEIHTVGTGTVYAVVMSEGLELGKKFETYDRYLQVRRTWKDSEGQLIDPAHLQVGQLVQVEVTLELLDDADVNSLENIAIVDALPAGLEVENPKLQTSGTNGQSVLPSRVQFMDDRVVMFASAHLNKTTFVYFLRATTAGRFEQPPIQASCMYDPEIASVNGGGPITVSEAGMIPSATSRPTTQPSSGPTSRPAKSVVGVAPTTRPAFGSEDVGDDSEDGSNDEGDDAHIDPSTIARVEAHRM